MPTVTIDPDELRTLAETDRSDEELKADLFELGIEFEGRTPEDEFELEFAPDRLDRLSTEGIARSLRYHHGTDRGIDIPKTNGAEWRIEVDPSLPPERPVVTGAIARGVSLDGDALQSLIQLQEKLHNTIGRGREKGSVGIHDLSMLKGQDADETGQSRISYRGIDPDGDSFVPLEVDAELTPGEVLAEHPTGRTYAHILDGFDRLPVFYDDIGLFSYPPIINGRRTELTESSRDLFIEMTGTDQWTIDRMLAIVCYALDARGATLEDVEIEYPDRSLTRPDLSTKTKGVDHVEIERVLGVDLESEAVLDCFERSGLAAERTETGDDEIAYRVEVPPYRVDVLHPVDLIDDVGRAYGFNDLPPRYPDVSTVGSRHEPSRLATAARNLLIGLGFEDLLNFHLISEQNNFDRMGVEPAGPHVGCGDPVTIREPYSEEYEIVRTWALPSLLLVLENNTHRAYPQDLAEVGYAMRVDPEAETGSAEWRSVAGVLARTDATYEDAKGRLEAIARNFDVDLETPRTAHPTFIDGRSAAVQIDGENVGVVGEVHPAVLREHDLELPIAAFEFRLDALASDDSA